MSTDAEKLGKLQVEIEANVSKFKHDLENLKQEAEKKAQTIQDAFNRRKIAFDNKFAKMRISELRGEYQRLQAEFQKKLSLNVSTLSLKATKDELNQVRSTLDDVTGSSKKQNLTGWALGITAVNQAYQFLTSSLTDLKNIIGGAARASTELEVLRANFKGTAEDIELFQKATADTVTEANLIKLSNQATDLGISLKDQALLFSLAEDAGDKYGKGVEDGFARVLFATEGNIRGLKDIGVQKEIYEQIVNDLAKAHGNEINNLDAETQKQIRLQAIIQASGVTLEDVKNKVKDNADKIASLTVRVEEAKVKLGELVSKALLPLIDTFDKSGKTGKDFASVVLGVGSVAMSLLPVLVQLRTAQALLGAASLTAASQIDATTASVVAFETAAKGSFLMKLMPILGAISGAGAAAFVVFSFKELDKPEDSVVKKILDESGFTVPVKLKIGGGKETKGTGFQTFEDQELEKTASNYISINGTAGEILKKIKALSKANEDANISIVDYKNNLAEIERLQKILSIDTDLIEEAIKKIQTENELKALTTGLSIEILESAKQLLQNSMALAKTDEDRVKILREIKGVEQQIADIRSAFDIEEIDPGNFAEELNKQFAAGEEERQAKEKEAQEILQELKLRGITNEFDEREARINAEYDLLLKKYSGNAEMISEIEKARQTDLLRLERDRFSNMLSTAGQIGDILINKLGIAGHTFVAQLMQALDLASNIFNLLFGGGGGGGLIGLFASFIPGGSAVAQIATAALKQGGQFYRGNVTPYSQIPKFAGGVNFKVPPKYVNDSMLMRVSAGEKVTVTPAHLASRQDGMNDKLLAQIKNAIVAQTLNQTRPGGGQNVTIKIGGRVIAEIVQSELNRMIRSGYNLSEF